MNNSMCDKQLKNIVAETKSNQQVLVNRLDNLSNLVEKGHDENKGDHHQIIIRQDKTNGSVRKLELWRMFLIGAWAVVSLFVLPLLAYFSIEVRNEIRDLRNTRNSNITKAIEDNNNRFFEIE